MAVAAVLNRFTELSGEYRIVLAGPGPYDRRPLAAELAPGVAPSDALAAAVVGAIKEHIGAAAKVVLATPRSLPITDGKTRRIIREEKS